MKETRNIYTEGSEKYIDVNRELWNQRTLVHMKSAFYDLEGFKAGKNMLNEPELNLLGNVGGKSILHLQCHFGLDTLSLSRMGAVCTGVDFSEIAIGQATRLADEMGLAAQFICCDVYDLPKHLETQFDIVFTSYGVIGWLPDLDKWAMLISNCLKPGGKLVFAEFHPVIWMFDYEFTKIQYSYFNEKAIIETSTGTYADKDAEISLTEISWNHSLEEVISSLLKHGLEIIDFKEFDYSPYQCFNKMVKVDERKFRIEEMDRKLPMIYTIAARKSG